MAKKFSISEDMLSGISKNTKKVSTLEAKENFKIEYIDIGNIIRNKNNFYEITEIDELAEDIQLNGLNHNLVVRPIEDGLYELISGERRYTALKDLVDKGENRFKKVPCKVSELNDLDSEIVLIQANAQSRELSEVDKLKQVERLTELYKLKKSKGEKVGQIRKKISQDTGLSPAQIGRYSTISKGLIKELKEILEKGNLSIANASEFAVLSEENQRMILDIIKNEVSINKNEAIELKNQLKKIEKEKEELLKDMDENKDIDEIVKEKTKEVVSKFEKEKIKKENKNLKTKSKENGKKDDETELHEKLKIRLKSIRKDMNEVTSLLSNNTIINEPITKEIENLKIELKFLNEQIQLYSNQEKIK